MPFSLSFDLTTAIVLFALAAGVVLVVGMRLTRIADTLADRTGMGEAVAGAVLLGASTSMSGTMTSVASAWAGNVDLAYSNALGGIAAQTAFLVVGDMLHRRANLEHAAASAENLTQATMLIALLTVPLLAAVLPPVTVYGVHPASVALVVLYAIGVRFAASDRKHPMWRPKQTSDTREDTPEDEGEDAPSTVSLWARFVVFVVIIGAAGWLIARTGGVIATETGIGGSVVGALMPATATSLPELVTTIAAVRRGALQLAVGGIIGGNTFDVLFLSASDAAYREGSIYHEIGDASRLWALVGILMTAVLLVGLIRRERSGPANIGFESVTILAVYVGAAFAVVAAS